MERNFAAESRDKAQHAEQVDLTARQTIEDGLRRIVETRFGTAYRDFDLEADLFDFERKTSKALDSLDHVEFVMHIEDEFRIEILDHEAEALLTISQFIDLIDSKIK